MIFQKGTLILALWALSACATPTPYKPAGSLGNGYKDIKLDDNKLRVSFKGNKVTERETVETYLFYRAAEATLENGFKFFRFTHFETDRMSETESMAPSIYGFYPRDRRRFPYYIYGPNAPGGGVVTHNEFEAVGFISMSKEINKEEEAKYYDASQILKNLKEKIVKEGSDAEN
jgi:hypothetical protein